MPPLRAYTNTFGPFTNGRGDTVYYKTVDGFRQDPPYDVVTYYRMDEWSGGGWGHSATSWSFGPPPSTYPPKLDKAYSAAKNRAYGKFVGKAKSDAASFGATLAAERKDTWAMFVSTVTKALRAAQAVKQMQFGRAAGILGVPYRERTKRKRVGYRTELRYDRRQQRKRPTRVPVYQKVHVMQFGPFREMIKSLAGGWLLWSYGVKPLAQDCYSAIETLTSETPSSRVYGRGESSAVHVHDSNEFGGSIKWSGTFGIVCGGTISVKNHDLYLITQLGLTNPAQWLLEGIPFSFVVDWFSNLSDVVNSMSELGGLEITSSFTSEQHDLRDVYVDAWIGRPPNLVYDKKHFTFRRMGGLVLPTLVFDWERMSWQRGANAISLLVQFLKTNH